MQLHRPRHATRTALWLLFWSFAVVALLVIVVFARAAIPVLVVIARGGDGRIGFFGATGFVVLASVVYLALAMVVLAWSRRAGRRTKV